jgi:hypothetical protein
MAATRIFSAVSSDFFLPGAFTHQSCHALVIYVKSGLPTRLHGLTNRLG